MPQAPTSRPKPPPPGDEEAGTVLKLGEFEGVETLSLSEASLVINALVTKRRNDRKNVNDTEYASRMHSSHSSPCVCLPSSTPPADRACGRRD